jgi:hypothetical protein
LEPWIDNLTVNVSDNLFCMNLQESESTHN